VRRIFTSNDGRELRIRYRIDGMLHKVDVPPQLNRLKAAIISRIKVMANLDIAEKRLRWTDASVCASTTTTSNPRVHDADGLRRVDLAPSAAEGRQLRQDSGPGFIRHDYDQVVKLINRPNGIFLVTGPTGSGKSTSLYAFLHEINKMEVRILTAEDPIE
jgi:type II secretory ATPase GspE/PulE/Tfp pilus assembly ATPase PilB-like protein